jgi:hypothetical protein
MRYSSLIVWGGLCFFASNAVACTVFCLRGRSQTVVGKNYDWLVGYSHGYLLVNPRRLVHRGWLGREEAGRANWMSRYGSAVFTQFGVGFPTGGINEAGLVVEMLVLPETEAVRENQATAYVNESQWVQYQLDRFASVGEVEKNLSKVQVRKAFVGIHYFVSDASGDSMVVEFLKGKPVVYSGANLPLALLTNSPYGSLLTKGLTKKPAKRIPYLFRTSAKRFERVANELSESPVLSDDMLFPVAANLLQSVKKKFPGALDRLLSVTQWQLLYVPQQRLVFFSTDRNRQRVYLDLNSVDFHSLNRVWGVPLDVKVKGPVTDFLHPFSIAENTALIGRNFPLLSWKVEQRLIVYGRVLLDPKKNRHELD